MGEMPDHTQKNLPAQEGNYSLISLAIPILIEQVLRNLLGTINVFMLGKYSDEAVAAVGVANQIISVVLIAFTMIASGAAIVINQSLGAGKESDAGRFSMNAVGIGVASGAAVSAILLLLATQMMKWLGLEEDLIASAAVYLRWVGGASVFIALSSVIAVLFRCYGKAKIPMIVIAIVNLLNFAGNYLVIFRPFPFVLQGVEGVGIIRFASEAFGAGLLIILLIREHFKSQHVRDVWHIKPAAFRRIAGLGFMTGAEGISYMLAQVVTTGFLTAFGTAALSAKVYVNTIDYYAYVIGNSIGAAVQIISGRQMGARQFDQAYRNTNRHWFAVLGCNMFFSAAVYVFHRPLMSLFTGSEEVIALSAPLFLLCIAINFGRSLNHTFNYGLRAAGFTFWPMIIASTSIWLINCGMGYVFSTALGLGVVGLWIAMAADDIIRGSIAAMFWRSRRWEQSVLNAQRKQEQQAG